MSTSIGDTLAQYKIIPVLVLEDLESGLRRCELLCECGLPVAEITFRTKAAESIIRRFFYVLLKKNFDRLLTLRLFRV